MGDLTGALAVTLIFGSIPAIIISLIYFKNRRIERTALIAAGMDVSVFESKKPKHYLTLKYGMLLVGLAVGLILGGVLEANTVMNEAAAYVSMVLLFGGLSLIIFYAMFKNEMLEK